VLNNQLIQKTIIKKAENMVQLKTNYSVTSYTIERSVFDASNYTEFIERFMRNMKLQKKLKKAEVIDQATEKLMIEYGIPLDIVSGMMYKYVHIKTNRHGIIVNFENEVLTDKIYNQIS